MSLGFRGLAPTAKLRRPSRAIQRGAVLARRGVTLVELLAVILIMLLITAITVAAIAPSMKNRDVREAARMIDVFINGARTRAMLNGNSYGVMIERMPGQPNGAVTLSYCEQPDAYAGDFATSTIQLLGNGGFGAWAAPPTPTSYTIVPVVFPQLDSGWIAGPAPNGGWLTNIAPGDVMVVKGVPYRIWAGEPFIDIDQNGVWSNPMTGFAPNTPIGVQEPFLDSDGNGVWTPPNPAPGQPGNVPGQPYVDPGSGYFVQPDATAGSPFPIMIWGTPCAFVTYAPFDPVQSAQVISNAYTNTVKAQSGGAPVMPFNLSIYLANSSPGAGSNWAFSFVRRPIKTSAPSMQLPGGAVIDMGANYLDTVFSSTVNWVVPVPGSGMEVLAANGNAAGFWSTFRANPALDPAVQGSPAQLGSLPSDPTSIMITFQPTGTVDRVYSWSEANDTNSTISVVNWTDWQGRIPAGPIYLLIGRQELLNGDPDLVPLIPQGKAPLKPIYNVQDPSALWVVINPQTGAVATAENVGYDLTSVIPQNPDPTSPLNQNMPVYWAANVYYARRLARSMLDMGGR